MLDVYSLSMQSSDESGKQRRYLSVAQEILTAIATEKYAPNERLPAHNEIAAQFGVSRPTAREAFLALELIGAIEVRHGDGTFVRQSRVRLGGEHGSPLDVPPRELIETRWAIEPVAVSLAAKRITPERIELLDNYIDEQQRVVEDPSKVAEFVTLGLRFHADLAPGCGNALLADVISQLVNTEQHPLWALVNQQAMPAIAARQRQVDEHRAILDAVRGGDGPLSCETMQKHLGGLDRTLFMGGREL
ncbi:HTH-type transcriptional regulator LutR [Arthrobacter sp. Bi83]|nr:HTH-type transcriptional regulator LutR [Arthrobacter sp. Bi83]